MPNHVTNRLQIVGKPEEVKKVLGAIKGKDEKGATMLIDFNKIVPMPEDLNITETGWLMPLSNPFAKEDSFYETMTNLKNYVENNPKDREETINNFIQGIKNFLTYGQTSWYGWATENWGTKWNAYGQNKAEDDTIVFDTAWATPVPVMIALSKKFPKIKLHISYADEDMGYNCGTYVLYKGNVVQNNYPEEGSREALEFACMVKECDPEEYSE